MNESIAAIAPRPIAVSAPSILIPPATALFETKTLAPSTGSSIPGPVSNSATSSPSLHTSTASILSLGPVKIASKGPAKPQAGMNGGRWTEQEHQSFLAGLRLYGREWKKVASKIKTRTSAQIRSHAQKYFAKLARDEEARRNGQDPGRSSSLGGGDSYFSDGGSSSALNSGDETDSISSVTVVRAANLPSSKSSSSYSFGASYTDTAKPGSMNNYYRSSLHAGYTKKRSRSPDSSPTSTSGVPSLNQHKRSSRDALEVEHLPSQEELLEKVSPNVRQRLSSLIEAEMCALQVLSCYASLQQKDHCTHASASSSSMYHPTKKPMSLAMITEQIPSTSSIY